MGEIYAHSQQVLVWIGEDLNDLGHSFKVIEFLHQFLIRNEENYPYEEFKFNQMHEASSPVFFELLKTKRYLERAFQATSHSDLVLSPMGNPRNS